MTVKSGYLNNPPKVIVIEDDNRPGSYPGLSSPRDIARSPESNRPYRDDVVPLSKSPYATAKITFLSKIPALGSTVTLVSTSGNTSTFTFKTYSPFSPFSAYDVNVSGIAVSTSDVVTNSRAAALVSQRFIETVSKVPGCEISAELGSIPGEVILKQTAPGSAGNTTITTTVSSSRLSIESFSGGSNTEIRYPYGMVISDADSQTSEVIRRFIKSERSGTLSAPGDPDPMRFTAPTDQHPYTLHRPYDESNSQQSFGVPGGSDLYGSQTELYSNFFTRGSVPGSLDEPLGTKDKIEIDLTPNTSTTIRYQDINGQNYPMCYYNFSEKKWDKIGKGEDPSSNGSVSLDLELDSYYIGFGQGYGNETYSSSLSNMKIYDNELLSKFTGEKNIFRSTGWNTCIDTFGFPVHPKYHATSSQQLDVSSLVDRPFIVEKFIYEFSGSSPGFSSTFPGIYYGLGGTFFILNQRVSNPDPGQEGSYTSTYIAFNDPRDPGFAYSPPLSGSNFSTYLYNNGGIPRKIDLTGGGSQTYVNTTRDIISYARVGTITSDYQSNIVDILEEGFPHPAEFMDLAVELPPGGSLDGIYTISSNIKAPSSNPATSLFTFYDGSSVNRRYYLAKDSCTRNSLDIPTGRSYNSEFLGPDIVYNCVPDDADDPLVQSIYGIRKDSESSPYIIRPGDKLIFGWQSLLPSRSFDNGAPPLELGPGAGKLILYGSYLRDNKPIHDIYKDQLISDSIHETIPAGPSVLDRFDTEPTMVFSGSMREEYIRGEMFERRSTWYGDANLIPISVDSKKVRKVRGRASDGNLGKRASFSRNIKLFQEDSQYYDSMQPDPVKSLLQYSGSTNFLIKNYLPAFPTLPQFNFLFLGAPGDTIIPGISLPAAALASGTNRVHIGSFPFDPSLYGGIERVRKINSRNFTNARENCIDIVTNTSLSSQKIDVIGYNAITTTGTSILIASGGLSKNGISGLGPQNTKFFYPQSSALTLDPLSPSFSEYLDTNPSDSDTGAYGAIGKAFYGDLLDGVWNFISKELDLNDVNYHLSRMLGCFGDGFMKMTQYHSHLFLPGTYSRSLLPPPWSPAPPPPDDLTRIPVPTPLDWPYVTPASGSDNTLYGQIYRGTRYGLINPTPLYASSVFCGDRYGQFSDRLAQRQFTVFESERGSSDGVPVEVVFIDRETGEPLPVGNYSGSNSINLSVYCTSSLPYFDGEVRDRGLPLPEQSIYYVPTLPSFL